MISMKRLNAMLLTCCACAALAACGGDSTAELASPGDTGQNPGVPGGSTGGGSTSGGSSGGGTANCPPQTTAVTVGTETHCRLPSQILNDLTLTPGNVYQMAGRVDVGVSTLVSGGGDPAVLTVLPGVTVYASTENGYLVVNQGSKIIADGNASQPIIFTSAADLDYDDDLGLAAQRAAYRGISTGDANGATRGEWGGIVINGLAPTNNPTRVGEGNTGVIAGGTDAADNSGILRYVQVRYAGFDVGLQTGGAVGQNELNGIAFQAVGNGTIVDFVQVHNAFDDCFEMFGGTVNLRHIVCTGTNDDAIDWTDGWTGKLQFGLVVMNPQLPAGDGGIEADNLSSANEQTPRSNPILANVTIVGQGTTSAQGGTTLFRAGTAARFVNSVITGTKSAGLDIDGSSSYAQAAAGNLLFRSLFITSTVALQTDADDGPLAGLFAGDPNNGTGTNSMTPQATGGVSYINGTTENGRATFNATALDPFFVGAPYVGAVQSAAGNWTLGWTEFLNRAG